MSQPATFSPARPEKNPARFTQFAAVALVLALVAAYANSFRVPFVFDDHNAIETNATLRNFRSVWFPEANSGVSTSGRPLLNASLALDHALHGDEVFGYHVTNLLIHALAALVLFGVLRRTLRRPVFSERIRDHADKVAWAIAALWALHPLQT